MSTPVTVIGGGLAGSEAALQLAARGVGVVLWEQRPDVATPAHVTGGLAELVCSNSLKSDDPARAAGLLKEELRLLGSQLLAVAERSRLPGGAALVVDRERFSRAVTERVEAEPLIELRRGQFTDLAEQAEHGVATIVATGPLTGGALWEQLGKLLGGNHLYFYDATAPIISADSVDRELSFRASRYGKGQGADYLNCAVNEEQYVRLREALASADVTPLSAGDDYRLFEDCLPIEALARRGPDALRYGPLKPQGLAHPRTGGVPHAVVQLRWEDALERAVSLVGFQTRLRTGEQERVFRLIPGLARAKFVRHGRMHRNSYVDAPRVLRPTLQVKRHPRVLLVGQLTGLEGYVPAIATGLWGGVNGARMALGDEPLVPPPATCLGAMLRYMTSQVHEAYAPTAFQFGMFTWLPVHTRRRARLALIRQRIEEVWKDLRGQVGLR